MASQSSTDRPPGQDLQRAMTVSFYALVVLCVVVGVVGLVSWSFLGSGRSGAITVEGTTFVDSDGDRLVLRGVNYGPTREAPRGEDFDEVAALGANAVRVVMDMDAEAGGQDPTADIVSRCWDHKLVCILEVRQSRADAEAEAVHSAVAVSHWLDRQKVLAGTEDFVLLDLASPPTGDELDERWLRDSREAIWRLRAAGVRNSLVLDVPTPSAGNSDTTLRHAAQLVSADRDGNTMLVVDVDSAFGHEMGVHALIEEFTSRDLPVMLDGVGPEEGATENLRAEREVLALDDVSWLASAWCDDAAGSGAAACDGSELNAWGESVRDALEGTELASVFSGGSPVVEARQETPPGPSPSPRPSPGGAAAGQDRATEDRAEAATPERRDGERPDTATPGQGATPERRDGERPAADPGSPAPAPRDRDADPQASPSAETTGSTAGGGPAPAPDTSPAPAPAPAESAPPAADASPAPDASPGPAAEAASPAPGASPAPAPEPAADPAATNSTGPQATPAPAPAPPPADDPAATNSTAPETSPLGLPYCADGTSADFDGDGWGWEDDRSCIVSGGLLDDRPEDAPPPARAANGWPYCEHGDLTDPDLDGWGYEHAERCVVPGGPADPARYVAEPPSATSPPQQAAPQVEQDATTSPTAVPAEPASDAAADGTDASDLPTPTPTPTPTPAPSPVAGAPAVDRSEGSPTGHPYCEDSITADSDGDGWGIEDELTCIVPGSLSDHRLEGALLPSTAPNGWLYCEYDDLTDLDDDGWGYEHAQSCVVPDGLADDDETSAPPTTTESGHPYCTTSRMDGVAEDGWGWENGISCVFRNGPADQG